jgi:hypothetical protein
MRIEIVSDVVTAEYDGSQVTADWVCEYIAGCEGSIVPGVLSWDNVEAKADEVDGRLAVIADLTTEYVVSEGEWKGERVNNAWVTKYIFGAAEFWLAPGVLNATDITFLN